MIDPNHLHQNDIPPLVQIEAIKADRKSYLPSENLRLPALTSDLEIDYTGLSFSVPQKVQFRYKLDGHDVDWQEPGTRRAAFYSDLLDQEPIPFTLSPATTTVSGTSGARV